MTTTNTFGQVDLLDPVYTIETVAKLFHVSVDTAREYSYRDDVPALMPWGRESVDREDVLRYASIGAGTCSVYPDIDNLHLVASIGRRRWDLCKGRRDGVGPLCALTSARHS